MTSMPTRLQRAPMDEQLVAHRGGWRILRRTNGVLFSVVPCDDEVPNMASDVDGRYRGTDLEIHQLGPEEGDHYTVFSLWDTYEPTLLAWIEPLPHQGHGSHYMLRMYEDGGQFARVGAGPTTRDA